jgi:hypothetical protein
LRIRKPVVGCEAGGSFNQFMSCKRLAECCSRFEGEGNFRSVFCVIRKNYEAAVETWRSTASELPLLRLCFQMRHWRGATGAGATAGEDMAVDILAPAIGEAQAMGLVACISAVARRLLTLIFARRLPHWSCDCGARREGFQPHPTSATGQHPPRHELFVAPRRFAQRPLA